MNHHKVRVRFAPSPTGHLHIGGLRTALFNWLFAQHTHGAYLMRIEDTDLERSKEEYFTSIMESFSWCGLMPDEPVVIQSHNVERHRAVAHQLIEEGKAYRCYCSPAMVAERQHERFGSLLEYAKYDGYCRDRGGDPSVPHVIRFALPTDRAYIEFDDLIRGPVAIEVEQLDDFVLIRSDRMPTYNFAVVIDDADMGITHVLRGEDHIPNTPKQILLYEACNFKKPLFGHLSMILGSSGQRLSKRDGATSVVEYKEQGFLPDALLNYLARLGWSHGDQEIFTLQELVTFFSLEQVGKKSAIFDHEKLLWVNSVHLRGMTADSLLAYLNRYGMRSRCGAWSDDQLRILIELYKGRVKTLCQLVDELMLLAVGPGDMLADDAAPWLMPSTGHYLAEVIDNLENLSSYTVDLIANAVKKVCDTHAIKLVQLAQPIRLALLGKTTSPGVFELMALLGVTETKQRLNRLMTRIGG